MTENTGTEMTEAELDGEVVEEVAAVLFSDVDTGDYAGTDLIDVMIGKLHEAKSVLVDLTNGTFTAKAKINKAVATQRSSLFGIRDGVQVIRAELLAGKEAAGEKAGDAAKALLKEKKIAAAKKLMEEAEAL